MTTLKEACEIIQKDRPNFRILGCEDYGDVYGFNLVPRRWDGDPENLPIGGCCIDTVDKRTGKVWFIDLSDGKAEKVGDLDIYQYLSEDDKEFAIKANKALEEYNEEDCEVFTL